jgi:hypothetical protein
MVEGLKKKNNRPKQKKKNSPKLKKESPRVVLTSSEKEGLEATRRSSQVYHHTEGEGVDG